MDTTTERLSIRVPRSGENGYTLISVGPEGQDAIRREAIAQLDEALAEIGSLTDLELADLDVERLLGLEGSFQQAESAVSVLLKLRPKAEWDVEEEK